MKKILLLFILYIVFINETISQFKKADLLFKDGTVLEGYGMVIKDDKIKFRISLEDELDIWDNLIVKGIIFYDFEITQEYEYIHTKNKKKPELLRIVKKGKITLYERRKVVWNMKFNSNKNTLNTFGKVKSVSDYSQFEDIDLFLKRKHEKKATLFNRTMKKSIQAYFKDCDVIRDMIEEDEYKKYNRIQLVNYYNVFCGE